MIQMSRLNLAGVVFSTGNRNGARFAKEDGMKEERDHENRKTMVVRRIRRDPDYPWGKWWTETAPRKEREDAD